MAKRRLAGGPQCHHGHYLLAASPCLKCVTERREAINAWDKSEPPACTYPGCGCVPAFSCPTARNYDRQAGTT